MINAAIKNFTTYFNAEIISDDIFFDRKIIIRNNDNINNGLYFQYLDIYLRIENNAGDKSDTENRNLNNYKNLPYSDNDYWGNRNKYTHGTRAAFRKNH
jgi:hypothetical protein